MTPTPPPGDWLVCWACSQVTASPYRVSPETGRTLAAGGYCPACYEDLCRRALREGREEYRAAGTGGRRRWPPG